MTVNSPNTLSESNSDRIDALNIISAQTLDLLPSTIVIEIEAATIDYKEVPYNPDYQLRLIKALSEGFRELNSTGYPIEALNLLEEIITISPFSLKPQDIVEAAKLFLAQNLEKGITACIRALNDQQALLSISDAISALQSLRKRELNEAIEFGCRALQRGDLPWDFAASLGDAYSNHGQYELAEKFWIDGFHSEKEISAQGLVYRLSQNNRIETLASLLSEIIRIAPHDLAFLGHLLDHLVTNNSVENTFQSWQQKESDSLFIAITVEHLCHIGYLNGHFEEAKFFAKLSYEIRLALATQEGVESIPIDFILEDFMQGFGPISWLGFQVKLRKLGWLESRLTILKDPDRSVNPTLLKYYQQHVSVIKSPDLITELTKTIAPLLSRRCAFLPFKGKMVREDHLYALADQEWVKQNRPPLLSLSEQDLERGRAWLHKKGMLKDGWFVTMHLKELPDSDPNLLCPRDIRDIKTYLKAIQAIRERGGWIIRLGNSDMTPLPKMDGVIDLAHATEREDWMDVFAWGSCRFYIGTNSGPAFVPREFGKNSVFTNWAPMILPPGYPGDIYIPKLIWNKSEKRFVSFPEAWSSRLALCESQYVLRDYNCVYRENDEEDLYQAIMEKFDHLDGRFQLTEEDERLQRRYAELARVHGVVTTARVGSVFLRKYQSLLW